MQPVLKEYACKCGCGKKWKAINHSRVYFSNDCAQRDGSSLPEPKRARRVPAKPRPGGQFETEWERLVAAAKERVQLLNKARMEVAEFALKACEVKHGGGGHWDQFKHQHTLRQFAEEVGISYKTLHRWVCIKRQVVDKLEPGDYDERNYSAATRTINALPPHGGKKAKPAKVRQIYGKEKDRKADGHHIGKSILYLKTIQNKLQSGALDLTKCERSEVNELMLTLNKIVKSIQEQGIESTVFNFQRWVGKKHG